MPSYVDTSRVMASISRLSRGVDMAMAVTLTKTAQAIVEAERAEMLDSFDRPTSYTLNSLRVIPATPGNLVACVAPKDWASKGTPAWKYLTPEVFGGPRRQKRFEIRLGMAGVGAEDALESGAAYMVPGRGATLDAYGNISRGQISQILSRLRAQGQFGSNISAKTVRRLGKKKMLPQWGGRVGLSDYFVANRKGSNIPLGIYRLVSKGHVEPVLIFTRSAPRYDIRFEYFYAADKAAQKAFPDLMAQAISKYVGL